MNSLPARTLDYFDGTHPESRNIEAVSGLLKVMDRLAATYFRSSVTGLENIPSTSSLVVGTHNGGIIGPDLLLLFHAWIRRFSHEKPLFALAHDIHFANPLTRVWMSQAGALKANQEVALKTLARPNHHVAVFPAGARELYKPFYRRHRVELHGHRGFVRLALRAQVPIVPTVSLGADTYLCLHDGDWLARLLKVDRHLRMPVWPIVLSFPFGLTAGPVPHFPLPQQIKIRVGKALELPYGPEAAEDDRIVDAIYFEVLNTMQKLRDGLKQGEEAGPARMLSLKELRNRIEHAAGALEQVSDWMFQELSHPIDAPLAPTYGDD